MMRAVISDLQLTWQQEQHAARELRSVLGELIKYNQHASDAETETMAHEMRIIQTLKCELQQVLSTISDCLARLLVRLDEHQSETN
jgi:hypothetical protein